jgi:hypothetical protein
VLPKRIIIIKLLGRERRKYEERRQWEKREVMRMARRGKGR